MSKRDILKSLSQKPMLLAFLMGFSSGLPLLLSSKTLQTWMSYTGGSNQVVGAMALVGLPYALKFIWAPVIDRFSLGKIGRRRSWLIATQLGVFASIAALSRLNPVEDIALASFFAICISFFGASQDTVVDAYRRESLRDEELGLAVSLYTVGYRIAIWVAGGLVLILADWLSWNTVYLMLSGVMLLNVGVVIWADEPAESKYRPRTLRDAVVLPLKDFFTREGAWVILLFILLYKVGDAMAGNMLPKFYAFLAFTPTEVGLAAKSTAPFSVSIGTFLGGLLLLRLGIYRSLLIFGIVQALSTLSFLIVNFFGHNIIALTSVVFFEDFSSGLGSAAFLAYMASLTNVSFTATQYALLSSLTAVPRTVISSITGILVETLGWNGFFTLCALAALPGLWMITYLMRKNDKNRRGQFEFAR